MKQIELDCSSPCQATIADRNVGSGNACVARGRLVGVSEEVQDRDMGRQMK